jgi:cell wall assembly regulator SMI1
MLVAALDRLLGQELVDEDGKRVVPSVLPGMSADEIAEAERALGSRYPPEVSALLRRTREVKVGSVLA